MYWNCRAKFGNRSFGKPFRGSKGTYSHWQKVILYHFVSEVVATCFEGLEVAEEKAECRRPTATTAKALEKSIKSTKSTKEVDEIL